LKFNELYSIIFINNIGKYMTIIQRVVSKITVLFNTPDRADFSIRDEVPLRHDPLLEGLIQVVQLNNWAARALNMKPPLAPKKGE
jgi:hypothetical protein